MSRKALEKFDPEKLKPGATKMFEVVNPQTHYHEIHYFYRDRDGEFFSGVTNGFRNAHTAIADWKKLKKAKPEQLKQMELSLVPAAGQAGAQETRKEIENG